MQTPLRSRLRTECDNDAGFNTRSTGVATAALVLGSVLWVLLYAPPLMAQQARGDSATAATDTTMKMDGKLPDVVVTAARHAQLAKEVSVP